MELKKVNEILGNLLNINPKLLIFVEREDIYNGLSENSYGEGTEGEYNSWCNIYRIKGEDLFLKVIYYTDSYGEERGISGIQFVQEVKKTVKTFKNKEK